MSAFISNLLNLSLFTYICYTFFLCKYTRKQYAILYIGLCLLTTLINLNYTSHYNFIFMFFSLLFLVTIVFKGSIVIKIVTIFLFTMGMSICELITLEILLPFFNVQEFVIQENSIPYFLGVLISNMFMLLLVLIVTSFYKTYKHYDIPKFSLIILILPATTICMILGVSDYYQASKSSNLNILILFGLLLSNLVSIYILYKTLFAINQEKESQYEIMKSNFKYEVVHNLLNQNNKFLHNIRNNTKDMIHLLEKKDYQNLEKYIVSVFSQTTRLYNMMNSDYKIVDVIINDNIQTLEENEINVRVKLESTNFHCEHGELERLFRAMIDTAISECIKTDFVIKNIIIKSKEFGDQVAFCILYSSMNDVYTFAECNQVDVVFNICKQNHLLCSSEYDKENKLTTVTILFDSIKGSSNEIDTVEQLR